MEKEPQNNTSGVTAGDLFIGLDPLFASSNHGGRDG